MKERGFTVVEVVVVVVLLAVVGGGVYVWQQKTLGGKQQNAPAVTDSGHNSTASPSASPTSSPTKPSPTVDVTAGWNTFIDPFTKVTLRYPKDWKETRMEVGGILLAPDAGYTSGVTVIDSESGLTSDMEGTKSTVISLHGVTFWKLEQASGPAIYISKQTVGTYQGKPLYLHLESGSDVDVATAEEIALSVALP